MLNFVLILSFTVMIMALLFGIIRLYQGPGAVDRVIIFELFTSIAVGMMAIAFLWLNVETMLDVGLLLSIVAFVGTISYARYIEGRERE